MVHIQLGAIQSGAWSDNVGIFSGQNIQNAWDSHAPSVLSFGNLMGDWDVAWCNTAVMRSNNVYNQPLYDQDVKGNASILNNV